MASDAHASFQAKVDESADYLSSADAERSFARDPYWPKWNSPWWHMTLMWELGAAKRIPDVALKRLVDALKTRYIHFFPFTEREIPAGVDPISGIMCHCGMGTVYQILRAAGIDVDAELPWMRKWFVQYQMEDGGWNCDEAAYIKAEPKSSVVSTLPVLESLLCIEDRSQEETQALDAGAHYLIKRNLVRSMKSADVINDAWLQLTFPRFYEYDILRGFAFCVNWAKQRNKPLSAEFVDHAVAIIESKIIGNANDATGLPVERQYYKTVDTRLKNENGEWTKGPSSEFPLLVWASQIGQISPSLTYSWNSALTDLKRLSH